ncbi:MAG: hypothetical protein KIT22_00630 [Verrucomicrobiae bacterium]|nr:hypothetical protein [Verrucomicrobiae bacterium]
MKTPRASGFLALDRLADFFRARGFAVPSAAGSALLTHAVKAAPAGLAASASSAGLAAGGAAGGLNLVLLQLSRLTKTQNRHRLRVAVRRSLGWQWRAQRKRGAPTTPWLRNWPKSSPRWPTPRPKRAARAAWLRAQADTFNAASRLAALEAQRRLCRAPRRRISGRRLPVARIPKAMLRGLLEGVANKRGD